MGKMNELSMLVDELHKCGETLVEISEGLADLFSGTEEKSMNEAAEKKKAEGKAVTLESVRAILAEKSRTGYSDEIKALLKKYGADRLSDISQDKYEDLIAEAEAIK